LGRTDTPAFSLRTCPETIKPRHLDRSEAEWRDPCIRLCWAYIDRKALFKIGTAHGGKHKIQGALHCGGKSSAFGRDDVRSGVRERGQVSMYLGTESETQTVTKVVWH